MLGKKLKSFNLNQNNKKYVTVKESVFPFDRFPGEDIILGPEMKSTGEVMGIDKNFPMAFLKSQMAAGNKLPERGQYLFQLEMKIKKISYCFAKL